MTIDEAHWSAKPYLRILIPTILGILLYQWIGVRTPYTWGFLFLLLVLFYYWIKVRLPLERLHYFGLIVQVTYLLIGYSVAGYQDQIKDADHFSNYTTEGYHSVYGLVKQVKKRNTRYEAVVCVHQIMHDGARRPVSGLLNAYIPLDAIEDLVEGQHIALHTEIIDHPPARNPYAFDYGDYLEHKRIFQQTGAIDTATMISECTSPMFFFSRARQRILSSLQTYLSSDRHYSIAASIILGYRDAVRWETKEAFAKTGSMHILAVSGLHVGIVWAFAGLLINLIDNRRRWFKYLRAALYIIVIWSFVGLTGAPTSALRAAGLFTLITLANLSEGDHNLFHRLAIAAFGLLIWNTNNLFDVGFQLSFSAVLGIAAFIPIWDKIMYVPQKVLAYLWSGVGVTIGATLGTLPLTMYYFHYFPWTGLIAGVFVVLMATGILVVGVLFLLSFWAGIDVLLVFMGKILDGLIQVLLLVIDWIYNLPFGLISNISLSLLTVGLLYVIMINIRLLFDYPLKNALWLICGSLLIVSTIFVVDRYQDVTNRQIVFYHDYKTNAIEVFHHDQSILVSDDTISEYNSAFINAPIRIAHNTSSSQTYIRSEDDLKIQDLYVNDRMILFDDLKILTIDEKSDLDHLPNVHWDHIYLFNSPDVSIDDLFENLKFDQVIVGASNWRNRSERWREECQTLDISCHLIANENALILEAS